VDTIRSVVHGRPRVRFLSNALPDSVYIGATRMPALFIGKPTRGEGLFVRRFQLGHPRGAAAALTVAVAAILSTGCGSLLSSVKADAQLADAASSPAPSAVPVESTPALAESAESAEPSATLVTAPVVSTEPALPPVGEAGATAAAEPVRLAQTQRAPEEKIETDAPPDGDEDYDPWEGFNETMFEFNRRLDRYVLKPVARAYSVVMPEPFQVLISNGFDNIAFVPRTINSLLQGKWGGAGRELSRFLINSTAGIGGLFDAAKYWGIEKSREDFGQTLGVWGMSPGPYLILPFLEPLTVRDGIGKGVDSFMNPLSYFIPFLWAGVGMRVGEIVNDRALNLELFQGFEESVVDLYSAVRHGYLRRREQLIKE
jgi:phospholipid-binding lipoprotein MlaA